MVYATKLNSSDRYKYKIYYLTLMYNTTKQIKKNFISKIVEQDQNSFKNKCDMS